MEDLSENENTVAVLTIYYKEKQLTNLVFKRREMADKFVDTLQQLLNEEGKKDFFNRFCHRPRRSAEP